MQSTDNEFTSIITIRSISLCPLAAVQPLPVTPREGEFDVVFTGNDSLGLHLAPVSPETEYRLQQEAQAQVL